MSAERSGLRRMVTAAVGAGLGAAVRAAVRTLTRPAPTAPEPDRRREADRVARRRGSGSAGSGAGPGERPPGSPGPVPAIRYSPRADGRPDPGEVVWTWVPFEDDPARGKDRPVLIIAEDGDVLLGLALTSKDHDRDATDEARWGRHWMDVGSGGWDPRGRPSEVRLDRVLRIDPDDVRREGAALPEAVFQQVVTRARELNGW